MHAVELPRCFIGNSLRHVKGIQYVVAPGQEIIFQHMVKLTHPIDETEGLTFGREIKSIGNIEKLLWVVGQVFEPSPSL